ncbi:MAG: hypothetical protein ACYC1Z_14685 [Georgenia sp.]
MTTTSDLTPDARARIEAAVEAVADAAYSRGFEAVDCSVDRDDELWGDVKDARAALLATVAALVSEAVAAERANANPRLTALPELLRRALRSAGYPMIAVATYPELWRRFAGHAPVLLVPSPEADPDVAPARPHPHTEEP